MTETFLPPDIVGGSVPYFPGLSDYDVWRSASFVLGTDKVAYSYTVQDGRCWYLATASSSLANNPDSWCPLAAALPGNQAFKDKVHNYVYENDGIAAVVRWNVETGKMQVFCGLAPMIIPRVRSLEGDMIAIDEDVLSPVTWTVRSMRQENLIQSSYKHLVFIGLMIISLCVFYIGSINVMTVLNGVKIEKIQSDRELQAKQLLQDAATALKPQSVQHLYQVQTLLSALKKMNGTLLRYEVGNGERAEWEALIPMEKDNISAIGPFEFERIIYEDGRQRIRGAIR